MNSSRLLAALLLAFSLCAVASAQTFPYPHVGLPSAPTNWDVSPDGKLAVAIFKPDQRNENQPASGPAKIILVDLVTPKIIAIRILDAGVGVFAINNQNVFVSGETSNVVYQLSAKDLSQTGRVFASGQVLSLCAPNDQSLWVETALSNVNFSDLKDYQLPGLAPTSRPALQLPDGIPSRGSNFVPVGQYWYRQGFLYDSDARTLRMILAPPAMMQLANDDPNSTSPNLDPSIPRVGPWGAFTADGVLLRGDNPIGQSDGQGCCVLPDIPAALSIGIETFDPNAARSPLAAEYVLHVRDLATGESVQSIVLVPPDQMPSPSPNTISPILPRIISRPGVAVVQAINQFYIIPTKSLGEGKISEPVNFPLTQSVFSLNSTEPTKIPFQANGGKAPLTYSLSAPASWASIDSTTGLLTIDNSRVLQAATDQVVADLTRGGWHPGTQPSVVDEKVKDLLERSIRAYQNTIRDVFLTDIQRQSAPRFQEILGNQPTGFPIVVTVRVIAKDNEQMTATIQEGFLLDVPIAPVKQKLLDLISRAQSASPAFSPFSTRPSGGTRRPIPTVVELQNEIDQLKEQNAELKDQIKSLRQAMGTVAPSTQP